jgi:hypothetical protein
VSQSTVSSEVIDLTNDDDDPQPSIEVDVNKQHASVTTVAASPPQTSPLISTSRPETPPGPRHQMVRNYREDGWQSTDGLKGLGIHDWVVHEQKLGYLKPNSKLTFKDDLVGFFESSKPYQPVPSFWQLVHWSNTELAKEQKSSQEWNEMLAKRAREATAKKQSRDLLEEKREERRLKQKAMKARKVERVAKKIDEARVEEARAEAARSETVAWEDATPEAEMNLFGQDWDDADDEDSEEIYSSGPLMIEDDGVEMEADAYFEREREKKRSRRAAPVNNEQVEFLDEPDFDDFTALLEDGLMEKEVMEVDGLDDFTALIEAELMAEAVVEEDEVSSEEE